MYSMPSFSPSGETYITINAPTGSQGIPGSQGPQGIQGPTGSNRSLLLFGNSSIAATNITRYLSPCCSDNTSPTSPVTFMLPFNCILRNFYIKQNVPAGNGNIVQYNVRKNSISSSLSISISSTSSFGSNNINSITCSQGDLIDIEITKILSLGASPSDVIGSLEILSI